MAIPRKKDKNSGQLETKLIKFSECKLAANEESTDTMQFSGYGAAFGNIDSYGDIIQKGAFKNYLADVETGKQEWPAMLTQHGGWAVNANDLTPVGVYTDLKEDDFGLKTAGNLAPTPRGTEIHTLMKMQPRPAISGLSIGFFIREFEYGGKNDPYFRLLKRVDLVEISIVTFPANGKARVSDVKSVRDMTEREFEQLLRDVVGLSQKEAKTVISHGFRQLIVERDAGSQELQHMKSLLQRNFTIFE